MGLIGAKIVDLRKWTKILFIDIQGLAIIAVEGLARLGTTPQRLSFLVSRRKIVQYEPVKTFL